MNRTTSEARRSGRMWPQCERGANPARRAQANVDDWRASCVGRSCSGQRRSSMRSWMSSTTRFFGSRPVTSRRVAAIHASTGLICQPSGFQPSTARHEGLCPSGSRLPARGTRAWLALEGSLRQRAPQRPNMARMALKTRWNVLEMSYLAGSTPQPKTLSSQRDFMAGRMMT